MPFQTLLQDYFKDQFSDSILSQFAQYLALMSKWNKTYNLTAIKDPADMVLLHIADSLSINPYLSGKKIIDIGTGAGLPGIPLAIINPDKKFTLLDSNSKKTRFLIQVVSELKLSNVEIVHARVEDYKPAGCFDAVLSRAFSSLLKMVETTSHLCCNNGQLLAMKGIEPLQEIKELTNRVIVDKLAKLKIKGLNAERHLVIIQPRCQLRNPDSIYP